MARAKRRPYLTEPEMGPKRDFDTSRMTQDKGRTDEAPKTSAPMPSSKEEKKVEKQSMRDSLAELKKMGTNSQNFKETAEKSREETKKRLEKNRTERKSGAGREDMTSRQRQDTIMRREEEKKKKAQGMGGGNVVGS